MPHSTECTIYDTNICQNSYLKDQLSLEIKDVDDLAIAWVVYEDTNNSLQFQRIDKEKAPLLEDTMWLWRSGGNHGAGKVNITQWLHDNWGTLPNEGDIYLVLAIYDFPYQRWFSRGKWSFEAIITLNGTTKWYKHDFGHSDIQNQSYGLKYLKLFKIEINTKNNSLSLFESIEQKTYNHIKSTIETKYNYTGIDKKTKKIVSTNNRHKKNKTEYKKQNKSHSYIFDLIFIVVLSTLTYFFYKYEYSLYYFVLYNFIFLIYFFFRFKLGGKAWALVLRKKHDKELDSFMVILGLLFTASLGAITSFDFDASNMKLFSYYRIGVFTLYISTNLVFLYILSVISAYSVNSLKANRPLMLTFILLIGIGIFIQEIFNFQQNYQERKNKIEIHNEPIHTTKK